MKEIDCEFQYHPIGQGLFYTARVGNTNFIYDCGSISNDIEKEIDDYINELSEMDIIDYLIISHFDRDHINGVEYLLKRIKVKNVILPYLRPHTRLAFSIKNEDYYSRFSQYFLFDPVELLLSPREKDIDINPVNNIILIQSEMENIDYSNYELENYKDKEKVEVKPINKDILIEKDKWIFKLFNYLDCPDELRDFKNCLESGVGLKEECIKEEIKKQNTGNLEDCYEEAFGKDKLNDTSLILFHGPKLQFEFGKEIIEYDNGSFLIGKRKLQHRFSHIRNRLGYFLTGDANLNKQIYRHYSSDLENISIGTLPHHGSQSNFDSELLNKCNNSHLWISSSSKSKYNQWKHPHFRKVVIPILESNKFFGWCNENNKISIQGMIKF